MNKLIISLATYAIGFGLLFLVDWKIAVGVFLFVWGNNIQQKL